MYTRNCPKCQKQITHTDKRNKNYADKKQRPCRSCSNKKYGKDNSFYGKKHSKETLKKIKNTKILNPYKTSEITKNKLSFAFSGNKNPMYGKKVIDIWLDKYGIRETHKKRIALIKNQSIKASGKNNPMYGKQTPKKAGNGWSGWYKNHFFRSLRELSYIIVFLNNKEWKSAEKIRIEYKNYDGTERTYAPDFLVENKYLIEIKPKKLIDSPLIKLKTEAAKKYCLENNLEFQILDCEIIKLEILENLINTKLVVLTSKTEEKFKKLKRDYLEETCLT